ncbi:MAG: ATP-binding domain-containing protein, partial [Ilumatobacter sp.]|nr:ATP-binding domain-containing protein [Ilumatobacter sp.]
LVCADGDDEAGRVARDIVHADPNLVRAGEIAVLARTNAQLGAFETALQDAGIAVRRSAAGKGTPLSAAIRQVTALGSASQLRAWAHDTLEAVDALHAARAEQAEARQETARAAARADRAVDDLEAERRVAAALLEFLRDQPLGDGAGFRAWVAINNPFDDRSNGGVELLTFHAAKGREWHTVFVTGVESSLVPHKSATTVATRAEEGRLLYVATTRATDRLVLTAAERRAGYARTVSPFIAELDVTEPEALPPPSALRRRRRSVDPLLAALRQWREETARTAGVLPAQLCSDRDLSAIAARRPATAEDLAEATTFGTIMAHRLGEQILPLVDAARARQRDPQSKSTMTGA